MSEKYKAVCKQCLEVFGESDSPKIELPTKCDKCGSTKIGVEKFTPKEFEQLVFNIVISNKQSGVSKTAGFIISKDAVKQHSKNLGEMRKIIAVEMAKSLHQIVTNDKLLVDLIGGNQK